MCELKTQEIEITQNHRHADVSMRFMQARLPHKQQHNRAAIHDRPETASERQANKLLEPWWS